MRDIYRPALVTIMHSLRLNQNFPRALVHADPETFGLQLDDFYFLLGISQIQFLLGHLNMGDRTVTLIRIAHDDLELLHGQGTPLPPR